MVDVFRSYSGADPAQVALLAEAIEREGYSVWWDKELPPHLNYGDVITEKISQAKAAVVVWSRDAAKSEWVRAEADMARNQKKLVQTALDNVMPPLPFNQIQYAEIGDWQGEPDHSGWRKVKASLADLCGARAASATPMSPQTAAAWKGEPERERAAAPSSVQEPSGRRHNSGMMIGLAAIALIAVAVAAWLALRSPAEPNPAPTTDPNAAIDTIGAADDLAEEVPDSRFDLVVTIKDPDGYTNLRDAPSTGGKIIGRVTEGTGFSTYRQPGDWWQARLPDGTTGWIARSRIRIPGGPDGAPPPLGQENAAAPPATASPVSCQLPDSSYSGEWFQESSVKRVAGLGRFSRLTPNDARLARNEIYARKGYIFKDAGLTDYFSNFYWYCPKFEQVTLNPVEEENVSLLKEVEAGTNPEEIMRRFW